MSPVERNRQMLLRNPSNYRILELDPSVKLESNFDHEGYATLSCFSWLAPKIGDLVAMANDSGPRPVVLIEKISQEVPGVNDYHSNTYTLRVRLLGTAQELLGGTVFEHFADPDRGLRVLPRPSEARLPYHGPPSPAA